MFKPRLIAFAAAVATVGLSGVAVPGTASAGMFDMMNPSKWFNSSSNRDRYYDRDYYYGRGPYGYGGGPYGWGGGYPGYGYGYPGYGFPGYGYPYGGVPGAGTTQQQAPRLPE
ncbi:MAG: hypothetical protein U9R74_04615 [Pseudomonadota bacterium]|nr:hypothetical protein [Pseudomonadota bacterium]